MSMIARRGERYASSCGNICKKPFAFYSGNFLLLARMNRRVHQGGGHPVQQLASSSDKLAVHLICGLQPFLHFAIDAFQ
jgi:hypothetical protein